MQKALRINLLARNQAAKRAHRENLKKTKQEWDQWQRQKVVIEGKQREYVKAERKNRREDWIKGPLAPKRDAGEMRGVYGAIDAQMVQNPPIPRSVRSAPKARGSDAMAKGWVGEGIAGNVAVNDRVVVVNGREGVKGKIGTVKSVDLDKEEVTIDGINIADIEIPSWTPQQNNKNRQLITSTELPIPMSDVRLVYHLEDEETGFNRDVVVRHVRGGPPYVQREHGSNLPSHTRYIAGEEIELPWPEESISHISREEVDTARVDVEQLTFTPELITPPLPVPSIMDELRPKYKRDRERHDDSSWVTRKIVEDARAIWWQNRKILTPAQEKAELDIQARREKMEVGGRTLVSDETLAVIKDMQELHIGQQRKRRGPAKAATVAA